MRKKQLVNKIAIKFDYGTLANYARRNKLNYNMLRQVVYASKNHKKIISQLEKDGYVDKMETA